MDYTYDTEFVCSPQIMFHLQDDVVTDIKFTGGCNGNTKALSKILDGWTVEELEAKLKGNLCGYRPTSCADQLARAVRKAYDEQKAGA